MTDTTMDGWAPAPGSVARKNWPLAARWAWWLVHRPALVATLAALLSVALFSSVLAYIFWNRGVEAVGAQVAGLFIHLMPVFGVILAWLFLDERRAIHTGWNMPGTAHEARIACTRSPCCARTAVRHERMSNTLILTGIALTTRRGRAVVPAGTD